MPVGTTSRAALLVVMGRHVLLQHVPPIASPTAVLRYKTAALLLMRSAHFVCAN